MEQKSTYVGIDASCPTDTDAWSCSHPLKILLLEASGGLESAAAPSGAGLRQTKLAKTDALDEGHCPSSISQLR